MDQQPRDRPSEPPLRLTFDSDPDLLLGQSVVGPLLLAPSLRDLSELRDPPGHAFPILRPRDLVHFHVLAYHCGLLRGEEGPQLVPTEPTARLEVRFPFQRLAERAWYEVKSETPEAKPGGAGSLPGSEPPEPPPTDARAAHGTRLVAPPPGSPAQAFESVPTTVCNAVSGGTWTSTNRGAGCRRR